MTQAAKTSCRVGLADYEVKVFLRHRKLTVAMCHNQLTHRQLRFELSVAGVLL